MNRNLLFGMVIIIALFGFCDIDIMAQQAQSPYALHFAVEKIVKRGRLFK